MNCRRPPRALVVDRPAFYPCGCSRQKVDLGRCDLYAPHEILLDEREREIDAQAAVAAAFAADPAASRRALAEALTGLELGEAGA